VVYSVQDSREEDALTLAPTRHRFTVDDYYRMAVSGVLGEDDRVELLEGEVIEKSPIGSRHSSHVDRLAQFFMTRLAPRAIVRIQNPIRLSRLSEPQPDLSILRPRTDFYVSAHPKPADVFLVIEVADTSLDFDRNFKVPLYARSGIPEVWIVDLDSRALEVYREPAGKRYREKRVLRCGESVCLRALDDMTIGAGEVLGE
jgi:Uma2 family endonuclease